MTDREYEARVARQIAQYATEPIHDAPPIYEYWSNTYLRPKLNAVFGVDSMTAFYAEHILQRVAVMPEPITRILSIGAGDAELEVDVAQYLLSRGMVSFRLECLELSPVLIERANKRIRDAAVGSHVSVIQSDLNSWSAAKRSSRHYMAVLANYILHHIVELESLFEGVATAIGSSGVFLTADMIGRNGHMRWPEALGIITVLWDTLPDELKYNHHLGVTDYTFNNWDCCRDGGFEGVRAQDILPLLVRRFHFEKFLATGNLTDIFCDRLYGPNYDPNVPAHTQFIDSIELLNSLLLELGVIKPTMMLAVLSNQATASPRFWKTLTPDFCIRNPHTLDLSANRHKSKLLATAVRPTTISFRKGEAGEEFLRTGWSGPEDWGTWMVGAEAVIELPIRAGAQNKAGVTLRFRAATFIPKRLYSRSFTFKVGDRVVGGITFCQHEKAKTVAIETERPHGDTLLLRIIAHEVASPDEEGSPDDRLLGLALMTVAVY
jgi:hypothetical protein